MTGLLGAEAAVRAICEDLPPAFTAKSLKRELDLHWMLRKCLNRLDNPGYELLLSSLTSRVRSFLANHNRDSMAAVFWRLPLLNPALLLVALRGLRAARPVSAQGDCGQRAGPIGFSTD